MKDFGELHYGYRVSNPRYDWKVQIVPGIKFHAHVKVKKFRKEFKRTFDEEVWLDGLAIDIGTLKMPPHEGSNTTYSEKVGTKVFREKSK